MLYLIATPIGNLQDISIRALETMKSLDFILCEDTRTSHVLLKKYGIATPLKSFHKFSEKKLEEFVIQDLQNGKKIGLISDAGTPGINDPGQILVKRCREEGLPVTSIPGPSAPIIALSLSGFAFERFQFIGFFPKKEKEKKAALIDALFYPGITIFFESPKRVKKTLEAIASWGPQHEMALVREMTKIHEECVQGKAKEFLGREFRGEIVLLLEGYHPQHTELDPKKQVERLQKEFDLERQEAIKLAAELRGESKKNLYRCFISEKNL